MKDEESKDKFIDEALPELAKALNERFDVVATGWSAECWMTMADKNLKKLDDEKLEAIIISMESEKKNQTMIYEIKRSMEFVKDKGLVENIKLEEFMNQYDQPMTGRFTGLFKKIKDNV